jgi:hypothetical protein
MKALRALDRYWFGYGSPTAIGVFRILIGTLALVNLLMIAIDFDAWFTERGFVPQRIATQWIQPVERTFLLSGQEWTLPFSVPRLNLLSGVTDTSVALAFYALVTLAALFTALGLWTRVSTILLAIGIVTLHHRNALILHGGDSVLRICVLYLAIAPSGASCSLDRVLGLWRGKIEPAPALVSMWPQRLIAVNLALIYLTSTWHKSFGHFWRDGTAAWYPARLNEFVRFPYPSFVKEFPLVYVETYGTLVTQFAIATLAFYKPLRKYVLFAGLLMHGFIEYTMNVPLFAFMICSMYVVFYEGEEIQAWARRWGGRMRRFQVVVRTPAATHLRTGPAAALDAMDPLGLVRYDAGTGSGWEAEDPAGKPLDPVRASRSRSLGAWIVAPLPPLWRRMLRHAVEPFAAGGGDRTTRAGRARVEAGKEG